MIKYSNGTKDLFYDNSQTEVNKQSKQINENQDTVKRYIESGKLKAINGFWGVAILKDHRRLSAVQVRSYMESSNSALNTYNSGKSLTTFGIILGFVSGIAAGTDLGTRIAGEEGNDLVLALGGVGFITGFGLSFIGEGLIMKSVQLYNDELDYQAKIVIGVSSTGLFICFKL